MGAHPVHLQICMLLFFYGRIHGTWYMVRVCVGVCGCVWVFVQGRAWRGAQGQVHPPKYFDQGFEKSPMYCGKPDFSREHMLHLCLAHCTTLLFVVSCSAVGLLGAWCAAAYMQPGTPARTACQVSFVKFSSFILKKVLFFHG